MQSLYLWFGMNYLLHILVIEHQSLLDMLLLILHHIFYSLVHLVCVFLLIQYSRCNILYQMSVDYNKVFAMFPNIYYRNTVHASCSSHDSSNR